MKKIKCCIDCKESDRDLNCHDTCVKYTAEVLYNIGIDEKVKEAKKKDLLLNRKKLY